MSTTAVGPEMKTILGVKCLLCTQAKLNALLDNPEKLAQLDPDVPLGFEGDIKVYNRKFAGDLDFLIGAVIMGSAHLEKVEVGNEIDLSRCIVTGAIIFDDVTCRTFSHENMTVMGRVIFQRFSIQKGW